jgi:hypothetical protein
MWTWRGVWPGLMWTGLILAKDETGQGCIWIGLNVSRAKCGPGAERGQGWKMDSTERGQAACGQG